MRKLKYLNLFENFRIDEHHLGLHQVADVPNGKPYEEMWMKYQMGQIDYLKSKGLSQEVINYWTRPDTDEEHQENVQLPWFYNEVIKGDFIFTFKEGFFNVKEFYASISKKTRQERERKWENSIETGAEFFKGIKVSGNTPEEREKNLTEGFKSYINRMIEKRDKSKPICVEEPFNDKGNWIIVDGGHRLWALEKMFPNGVSLYCVKVFESKKK